MTKNFMKVFDKAERLEAENKRLTAEASDLAIIEKEILKAVKKDFENIETAALQTKEAIAKILCHFVQTSNAGIVIVNATPHDIKKMLEQALKGE